MGKRLFWFGVGVGLAALIVLKGREIYERLTPKGVADQLEKSRQDLVERAAEFFATMGDAMETREGELREALGLDE